MAISAATVWEVRASGASDNNGGGFVAGSGGTDYSQQNAAQLTLTDLATTGVVTTLTSATGGFTAAMVGNLIQIVSGTNFTAGFYQITAFTNSNTVTLDRAPSTAAGSAGTGSVGGALLTLGKLSGAMVASNKAYVTGAFTTTASLTFAQNIVPTAALPQTRVLGYGSARGDTGRATLTLQTTSSLIGISATGAGFCLEQLDIDCASLLTSQAISSSNQYHTFRNIKISNFTFRGLQSTSNSPLIEQIEVTGGTSIAQFAVSLAANVGGSILRSYIHDNVCPAISAGATCTVSWNLIVNNSGAASDGIIFGSDCQVRNNTIFASGRDGIRSTQNNPIRDWIQNNLLVNNGGFGVNLVNGYPAAAEYDGNAYFNNTSGARGNMDVVTGIFGVNPYVNTRDVILTASPFVGPTTGASANFGLNNTAGGGAACRKAGTPGAFPGLASTVGFLDMGAVQHADLGGNPRFVLVAQGQNLPVY